jgi:hypothetical protein
VTYDPSDPPSPLAVIRMLVGGVVALATLALLASCVSSGSVDWQLWGFVALLWAFWGFFEDIAAFVVRPFSGFVSRTFAAGFGGGPLGDAPPPITIAEETVFLEHLVATPPNPHRAVMAGIRLAEIYRTHQHDQAKCDELLDRLRAQYPDARELGYVRPTGA